MSVFNKIFLVGFMGAGKSFWGRKLSEQTGFACIDADTYMEQGEKKRIAELFANLGEQGFRALERQYLHQIAEMPDNLIVATGGGAPCFFDNMAYMNQCGCTVYLKMPIEVLVQRLDKEKIHRPLLQGLDTAGLRAFIAGKLEERNPYYEQSQYILTYTGDNEAYLAALQAVMQ